MNVCPHRNNLIKCTGLMSSYRDRKGNRIPIEKLGDAAQIDSEMFDALKQLNIDILKEGGSLFITDMYRSYQKQKEVRERYEKGLQKAYACPPGESFHNSGLAIDIDTQSLSFPSVLKNDWIKKLWDIMTPLGFRPVINKPEFVSECWHIEYIPSYLKNMKADVKYSEAAKCLSINCGNWDTSVDQDKVNKLFIQALLVLKGYTNVSPIDGIIGKNTKNALQKEGIDYNIGIDKIIEVLKK